MSRVSEADYERLKTLASGHGIRSVYALLNYTTYCFLRAVDAGKDCISDPLPIEIINMFPYKEDSEDIYSAVVSIRKKREKRKAALCGSEQKDNIRDDIKDLFDEAQTKGSDFVDDIRKRQER